MSRNTILSLACVAFASIMASAQADRRNELGLLLGATVTPELRTAVPSGGTLQIGSSVTFQIAYARELKSRPDFVFYFEVPALAVPLQRIVGFNGTLPRNYDSFFVTPGMRLKLVPNSRVSPWFSAGGGYALFDESADRMNGTHNTTRGTSGGAVQFGGGIDLGTPIRVVFPISFRLEVRDFYTSKPTYNVSTSGAFQHNVVFSGGLVVHF